MALIATERTTGIEAYAKIAYYTVNEAGSDENGKIYNVVAYFQFSKEKGGEIFARQDVSVDGLRSDELNHATIYDKSKDLLDFVADA